MRERLPASRLQVSRGRLLLLLVSLAGPALGLEVTRGPYLQLVTPTSATVVWRTDEPAEGIVQFGQYATFPEYGQTASHPGVATDHAVRLDGLLGGGLYVYRIAAAGRVLAEGGRFIPGAAGVFAVVGGTGGGPGANASVAANVLASEAWFWIHTGDLLGEAGAPAEMDRLFFEPYREALAQADGYLALGDDDLRSDGGAALLEAFHFPQNSPEPERFYSFEKGEAFFAVLDTSRDLAKGSAQHSWLDNELSSSSHIWKLVVMHRPLYSSSASPLPPYAQDLEQLFGARGVDIVFQGRDRFYERTFPILDGVVTDSTSGSLFVDPRGTIYIVTAGGGGSLDVATPGELTARYASVPHHVTVTYSGRVLQLEARTEGGAVLDSIRIQKRAPGFEDCYNFLDDDGDEKIDFNDTDCASAPESFEISFHRGDVDENGALQLSDGVRLLGYLFLGGPEIIRCPEIADADDNGRIEISDAIRILKYLFTSGPPPPPPGPPGLPCGRDPLRSPHLFAFRCPFSESCR